MKQTILAIDDEKDLLKTFQNILKKKYNILITESGSAGLKILQEKNIDLVLLDIRMPKMDGIKVLKEINKLNLGIETIMVTASKDVSSAVEAMKLGAFEYTTKPFDVEELQIVIEKALEKRSLVKENIYLKEALAQATSYCDLIGQTPVMKKIFQTIETIAKNDSRILITGESGTGKELVALAIHKKSQRAKKPFIAINCAALPESLLESELFGYERGAFTGALERKPGKFEQAEGGTIFLDEIGCMPAKMQAKLLRVLQDNQIDRIGGTSPVQVNIRIVSATNINFEEAIKNKTFREDLYYRLNVIPIHLPPLRERTSDIPLFLNYFLNKFNKDLNRSNKGYDTEALRLLKTYQWPGNVRELQNIIERLVALSSQQEIGKEEIENTLNLKGKVFPQVEIEENLNSAVANFEKRYITKALEESNGNQSKAAKILGVARTTMISKMGNLGLKQN